VRASSSRNPVGGNRGRAGSRSSDPGGPRSSASVSPPARPGKSHWRWLSSPAARAEEASTNTTDAARPGQGAGGRDHPGLAEPGSRPRRGKTLSTPIATHPLSWSRRAPAAIRHAVSARQAAKTVPGGRNEQARVIGGIGIICHHPGDGITLPRCPWCAEGRAAARTSGRSSCGALSTTRALCGSCWAAANPRPRLPPVTR